MGGLCATAEIGKTEPIFPRIDAAKELAELEAAEAKTRLKPKLQTKERPQRTKRPRENAAALSEISIEDFAKIELKVEGAQPASRSKAKKL